MKQIPVVELSIGGAVALIAFLAVQGFNVMPVVFLGGLLLLLTQTGALRGGGFGGGKSKVAAKSSATVPDIKFDDIGGQAAAKQELLEAIEFISNREAIKKMGIRPLKGVLLTGPPGTGKTLLAKAAAHHTGSVYLSAAGSEFVEMYAGVGAQRVRDLFRKARETARKEKKPSAVIFIDEIDVLGAKRGTHSSHMEYDQTLNQIRVAQITDDRGVCIRGETRGSLEELCDERKARGMIELWLHPISWCRISASNWNSYRPKMATTSSST